MNTRQRTCAAIAALTTLALGTTTTSADVLLTFDNRGDWISAVSDALAIEDLEDAPFGQFDAPMMLSSGLILGALSDSTFTSVSNFVNSPSFQNTTPGGENYLFVNDLEDDYTVQFILPQATMAFGFDIVNWRPGRPEANPQGASIELYKGGDLVIGFFLASDLTENGNVSFVGLTSTVFEFDEIRFTVVSGNPAQGGGSNPVAIDQVSWVVPAPGAVSALAIATGLTCRRRR